MEICSDKSPLFFRKTERPEGGFREIHYLYSDNAHFCYGDNLNE